MENLNAKKDYATFEDGLHEMILCEKICENNQKQQWVKI